MGQSKANAPSGDKTVSANTAEGNASGDAQHGGQRIEVGSILGVVTALMMDSPMHQHLFIADLKWLVIPAIHLQQFRVYRRDGMPFAYVSWGLLSDEVSNRMKSGLNRLRPDEWKSGEQAWIIDLIAPFGGHEDVLKDLKQNKFAAQPLRVFQPAPGGNGMAVVEL